MSSLPRSDDEIQANRQIVLMRAKRFPDQSFPTIALDCVADSLADRQTEPSFTRWTSGRLHDEDIVRGKGAAQVNTFEFGGFS